MASRPRLLVGSSEYQHARVITQPFADGDLLLVAAGQTSQNLSGTAGRERRRGRSPPPPSATPDDGRTGSSARSCYRRTRQEFMLTGSSIKCPLCAALPAPAPGRAALSPPGRAVSSPDGSTRRSRHAALAGAKQRLTEFGFAAPPAPGNAENFAFAHGAARYLQQRVVVQPFNPQQRFVAVQRLAGG